MYKKMVLKEIVVEGFKGFKEKRVIYLTDGKNTIIGENGEGKSSIGELICWVLTGKNLQGNTKELNVLNKDSKSVMGKIVFLDENGETHEIERKMTKTTTLKFDNKRITQKNLESLVNTDIFLLIFNPLHFLSLDAQSARKSIYTLLPNISKEDVMKRLSEKERVILAGECFDIQDTNDYLKNRRKELAEIEDNQKYLEGYMAKLQESIEIPAPKTFDDNKIVAIEKQLEKLNQRKPELKDLSELKEKKAEIEKELAVVKSQRFDKEKIKSELLVQKAFLEQQIKAEKEKTFQGVDTLQLEAKVKILRNDYANLAKQNNALVAEQKSLDAKQVHFHEGDQCPYCKQIITKEAVEQLNQELKKQVQEEKLKLQSQQQGFLKSLAELEKEGKQLVAEIKKAKKQDEELRNKFEEEKRVKIARLKEELNKVQQHLSDLDKEELKFKSEQSAKINKLTRQIQQLQIEKWEKENERIQQAFDEEIRKERFALQHALADLRKEKEAILAYESQRQALIKRVEANRQELEKKNKELEDYKKQMTTLNQKISCVKKFNAQKIALMNETFTKHLTNVSIKLEKTVQSTGEIADCFEILYNNKELKVCSTSERMKAGLEISHMISRLSGLDYPVFLDNGESITSYEDKATQTIETKVVKGKNLTLLKDGKEVEIVSESKVKTA